MELARGGCDGQYRIARRQPSTQQRAHTGWGAVVGAVIGFAIGAAIYLALTPVLEGSDGWIRELQGFAWNLVPGVTLLGAVLGWWVVSRRRTGSR